MTNAIPLQRMNRLIDEALEEDLALGDLTTRLLVDEKAVGRAGAIAKQDLVAAGIDVFGAAFARVDANVAFHAEVEDGATVESGKALAHVEGPLRSILAAERVALNFLQRLCGVAMLTRRYADALPAGSPTRIVDTRKTTPGMRALERHAVRCGGGLNHRSDLSGGIIVKDNHIAACGGFVADAVLRARRGAGPTHRVECEVTTLEQLDEAIAAGADTVMLDNMDLETIARAMERAVGRAAVEVSGRVRLEDVPKLARLGVDYISVGALTHSAPAADVSLEVETGDSSRKIGFGRSRPRK